MNFRALLPSLSRTHRSRAPRPLRLPLLLALLTLPGCRSPEDVGFEAGAKYIAIFVAIGADTMTMPCPERLAMAHEFADQGKANRIDLASDVGDAREEEGFDAGLKRIAGDTRTNVFGTFAKACPTEAPEIVELMTGVETELGITGKLPPLELPK